MEYVIDNIANISLVSNYFYKLLSNSDTYQNICKKEFRKSILRHVPIDTSKWKKNVADHVELIKDKTYVDKFFLINFFYLKNPKEHLSFKRIMLFKIAKKYSPSLMNAEYEDSNNKRIYHSVTNTGAKRAYAEGLMRRPGKVEIYCRNFSMVMTSTNFEKFLKKFIFFDYDKNTLEKVYIDKRVIINIMAKRSWYKLEEDFDKYIRKNFPRQN